MTEQNPPAAAFYLRAEKARKRIPMTKTMLEEKSGITRNTYNRLETQPGKAQPETILDIAKVLGIGVDEALELAGLEGTPLRGQAAEHAAERETRSTMADALRRRLPDLDDATLARVAMAMADVLQGAANELFEASEEAE